MTADHRKAVLTFYFNHLEQRGYQPERKPDDYRFPTSVADPVPLRHAAWMCVQALGMVHAGDIEKADRWLGHIQGLLWFGQQFTIEEERGHSRPPGREKSSV